MTASTCHIDAAEFYDLVIVGAGPCGLALAARLAERSPAALYTDAEHARMQWLRRRQPKSGKIKRKLVDHSAKVKPDTRKRILVLDATSGGWMGKWRTSFDQLGIQQLRSPLHFHLAPDDADALRAYAETTGRHDETTEVRCTEKQRKSKRTLTTRERQINERDKRDYMTASTGLFNDFCDDLAKRYDLSHLVRQAEVLDLAYGQDLLHLNDGSGLATGFCIDTAGGRLGARAVAIACGGTGQPAIPAALSSLALGAAEAPGWTHSSRFLQPDCVFPSESVTAKIRQGRSIRMVVIGGGLTSAQIADLAIRSGVSHVTLVCRSKLKVKPFDVPIEWVAKYSCVGAVCNGFPSNLTAHSSLMKAIFWQTEDMHERIATLKDARRGGSINPPFNAILQSHIASRHLALLTETDLLGASYDSTTESWTLDLSSATLTDIDHLVIATGSKLDIDALPWLRGVREEGQLKSEFGFPTLTTDLQVDAATPLFFLGAYAALQLGPAGPNLAGAREGAERVAHRVAELRIFADDEAEEHDERQALAALTVNHFASLDVQ